MSGARSRQEVRNLEAGSQRPREGKHSKEASVPTAWNRHHHDLRLFQNTPRVEGPEASLKLPVKKVQAG